MVPRTFGRGCSWLPTPTADLCVGAAVTPPMAARFRRKGQSGSFVEALAAKLFFLTPTASQDHKPVRRLAPSEAAGTHGTMLVGFIGTADPSLCGMYLHPSLSEWLMGFPNGWTDLEGAATP